MARQRVITRELAAGSAEAAVALTPRDDFVVERRAPGDGGATTFEQAAGPLAAYSRRVDDDGAAPLVCALGALAPSFGVLVATQTVGRPLGLALSLLVIVAASEDMPRNTRAYALSLLAMASGLGAGIAVMALPLAGIGGEDSD